jgi:hypothetical protein
MRGERREKMPKMDKARIKRAAWLYNMRWRALVAKLWRTGGFRGGAVTCTEFTAVATPAIT